MVSVLRSAFHRKHADHTGNYLISGGEETVLVLWQLESGRRQDLPHLGAPIESIVVSPAGASYSLRLADNSTMILSTTELRPIFSVTGIQIPSAKMDKGIDMPFMATVDKPVPATRLSQSSRIPACTSSSQPGSLLLAVPSSIPSNPISMTAQNASYLQTFDLASTHQISKQALTRTKVTSLNKGPEMNTIEEPNITHLQTSFDGQWLATIDEWTPPNRDLASLSFNEELTIEEQIFRQEIHIKFWLRNNETKAWELISRIDDPHASRTGNPYERSSILELTSDPSSVGFATLGSDGCVKIWKTTARRRHGLDVRGKDGRSLTSWFCKCTVPLESTELLPKSRLPVAKLAYSRDGSILAGALQSAPTSAIYIVDAYNGEIQSVQTGLFDGPLLGLGIIDKYLVTFSHELCVVDLVKDELQYGINLQSYGLSLEVQVAVSHLAVDVQRGIFAIALPGFSKNPTELRSQLAIFDPGDATPLFHTYVPNTINTLLSTPGRKGFIAIDSAAEVRILAPSQPSHLPPLAGPKDEKAPRLGLGDIFGTDQISRPSDDEPTKNVGLLKPKFDKITREATPEDSPVVVSQERLAEVFDVGPAYALPPIVDLFEQIASLYSGRTAS